MVEYVDSHCNPLQLSGTTYVTNYYYDEIGNLLKTVASNTQATSYSYDDLDRLSLTNYPDKTSESYTYDANGNIVRKTDRKNAVTSFSFDSLNRIVNITYQQGSTATRDTYSYDNNGNILSLKSLNSTITYAYDSRNRILSETYSVNGGTLGGGGGGGSVAAGTLITLVNGTAVQVQNLQPGALLLSYNVTTGQYETSAVTRMVTVETTNMLVIKTMDPLPLRVDNATAQKLWIKKSDGTVGWFSVTRLRVGDSLFNALSLHWSLVTSIEKALGGAHLMYDVYTTAPYDYIANGYLDPPKIPTGAPSANGGTMGGYAVQYFYNGEVVSQITHNNYLAVSYAYDGLGRVVSVSGPQIPVTFARFSYYKNSQVKSVGFGNGLNMSYTYDSLARTTSISAFNKTSVMSLAYSYNRTGTVLSVTGSSTDTKAKSVAVNENYLYDPLGRLTNSTVNSGGVTTSDWLTYDSVGNRVFEYYRQGASSPWSYNQYVVNSTNNELSSHGTFFTNNIVHYSYNPDGTLKQQNVTTNTGTTHWTYAWDVPGHLLKVSNDNGVQGFYAYDGLGRRVESVEGLSTTFYAYQGTETMFEIGAGQVETDYVYANSLRIARVTGYGGASPVEVYYQEDALGSTRLVTDSNRNVVFSDNYQPYGLDNTVSGSETYKFTGKPVSQTTGLYYEYRRWYDSSIGRFLSPDPKQGKLSNPQTLNAYIYVRDLPTLLTDPTGEGDSYHDRSYNLSSPSNGCSLANPLGCIQGAWNTVASTAVSTWNDLSSSTKTAYTDVVNTAKSVTKLLVDNVVVPLVKDVIIPLAIDYIAANNYIGQGLHDFGDALYNQLQLEAAFYHYESNSPDRFTKGLFNCGPIAAVGVAVGAAIIAGGPAVDPEIILTILESGGIELPAVGGALSLVFPPSSLIYPQIGDLIEPAARVIEDFGGGCYSAIVG